MNILRRLPLPRLLLACGLVVLAGVTATAIASAVSSGPVPAPKPLAQAVHDALAGPSVEGVSARVTLTDHLLEGAELAATGDGGGSGILGSPLVNGGSGRMWVAADGRLRLELQEEKGDTQVIYDGHSISVYDASTNTIYRYTPNHESRDAQQGDASQPGDGVPSVGKIEEAIAHIREHADLSEATPADVAGRPAYTVRISPREGGSLIGGAELSFDADHGIPLRAALYSSSSSSPVIELAATEISYGPVSSSTFVFTPPANAKVEEIKPSNGTSATDGGSGTERPHLTTYGHGISAVEVLEKKQQSSGESPASVKGLPTVDIGGASASELRTALGTILIFERSGVRYVVAGSVPAAAVEAVARGL